MASSGVFNSLFIKLQDKLIADIPDSQEIPGIRLVDFDLKQIDMPGSRPPIASGGNIYVDFFDTEYVQRQFRTQLAEMNVLLRLVFDPYSSSSSLQPQVVREKAAVYFEIEQKIYECLQDWDADGLLCKPFKRMKATSEIRDDKLRVRDILFSCTHADRSLDV